SWTSRYPASRPGVAAAAPYHRSMEITSRSDAMTGEAMDPSHFTGPVSSHPLHETEDPNPVRVSVVHFAPGTRNHWHSHGGGQVLHVVDGEGWVQSRGDGPTRIQAGDTVSAAPGEEHWHGAGPDAPMAHIAVTIGQVSWLEPSELEPPVRR